MQVDERLDDRQPEAGSGVRAAPVPRPVKAIEHARNLLFGHPDPGVGDDDLHPRPVGLDADVEGASLGRVQVRVGQQVGDDLADPPRIGERRRQRRRDVRGQVLVLRDDARLHQLDHLVHDLADIDRAPVDLDVVGLDPRHVEQVVDELDEPVGRLEDDVDELALALGHVLGRALEQLDEALDRGQRTAQLVRGGRDELALGPLEASTLAHVPHGPHDSRVVVAEVGGGHSERAPVEIDQHLALQRGLLGGQRAVLSVYVASDGELRDKLGCPRVHGRDRARSRLGDDQRVAEALDRDRQALALLLDPALGGREVLPHRVEGAGEVLELAGSGRVHPLLEPTLGQAVGRLYQLVEGLAHRPDQHRDQRERAGEREHAGDDDQQQRPAGVRARLHAGLRLADRLALLELSGEVPGPCERTVDGGGCGQSPGQGELAGLVLGGDLGADEFLAGGIALARAWSPWPRRSGRPWRPGRGRRRRGARARRGGPPPRRCRRRRGWPPRSRATTSARVGSRSVGASCKGLRCPERPRPRAQASARRAPGAASGRWKGAAYEGSRGLRVPPGVIVPAVSEIQAHRTRVEVGCGGVVAVLWCGCVRLVVEVLAGLAGRDARVLCGA